MKSMNKFNENETPFNGLFTITKNIIGIIEVIWKGYTVQKNCYHGETEKLLK